MSLPEAILSVVEDMEATVEVTKKLNDPVVHWRDVASWAKMLRLALKASEPPAIVLNPPDCTIPADEIERIKADFRKQYSGGVVIGREITERLNHPFTAANLDTEAITAAREAIRQGQQKQSQAEENSPRMVSVADGPANPDGSLTMVEVHPDMPDGARTMIAAQVYQLRSGTLYHEPQKEG